MAGLAVGDIEEVWHALAPPYEPLFAWLEGRGPRPDVADAPVFRPLMLSHALEDADWAALEAADFCRRMEVGRHPRADRGAAAARRISISRTGDDIGGSFPDVVGGFNFDAVLDGELLVHARRRRSRPSTTCSSGSTARASRKQQMEQFPAHVRLYDAC